MLGVQTIPATLYFTLLLFVPESPRWLLLKGREAEARRVLVESGRRSRSAGELAADPREPWVEAARVGIAGLLERFGGLAGRRMRFIMLVALGLAFFQQITGINAVFYYLPTIFSQAGGGVNDAFRQAVLVGLVNLGMTFVAIWLIDRLGRKPLLIAASPEWRSPCSSSAGRSASPR